MAKYFNRIIGFTDKTTKMLEDLEKLHCPNIRTSHGQGDVIFASNSKLPAYADVFDWLMDKGYTIHIEPCSTFASGNHNAWWWVLNVYDTEDAYEKKVYEDTDMYCKWEECANNAISKAIELLKPMEREEISEKNIQYEYVDLGLPSGTLWAKCNVGANSEEDYGGLYQWGGTEDVTDKDAYWNTYPYGKSHNALTKYNVNPDYGVVDNKTELDLEDDAAHVHMGGDWHMPTSAQIQELIDNTNHDYAEIDGVAGRKFVSKTDESKYIFIPFAGYRHNSSLFGWGGYACVWSSSLDASYPFGAFFLDAYCGDACLDSYSVRRYRGFSVRGVLD